MINKSVVEMMSPTRKATAITRYHKTGEVNLNDNAVSKWDKESKEIYEKMHSELEGADKVKLQNGRIIKAEEYDNFLKSLSYYRSEEFVEAYPDMNVEIIKEISKKEEENEKVDIPLNAAQTTDNPVAVAANPSPMIAIKREEPKTVVPDFSSFKEEDDKSEKSVKDKVSKKESKNKDVDNNTSNSEESVTEMKLKNFKHLAKHAGLETGEFSLLSNGLIQSSLIGPGGFNMPILLDLYGLTFSEVDKWFPTAYYPGFETQFAPLVPTQEAIAAAASGASQLDLRPFWAVSPDLWVLNQTVDLTTLKTKDKLQIPAIIERVYKAFQNKDFVKTIETHANGKPVRFSFAGVKGKDNFKLIAGSKNTLSFGGPNVDIDGRIVIRFHQGNATVEKKK